MRADSTRPAAELPQNHTTNVQRARHQIRFPLLSQELKPWYADTW